MTRYPPGTRKAHQTFCENDKWTLVRDATGGVVGHHITMELHLPDGRVMRTRISRPADNTDYGPKLWCQILKEQLHVTEAEFWDCAKNGVRPERTAGTVAIPAKEPIPLGVVEKLLRLVHLTPDEIEAMTPEQAIARLNQFWSENS